MDNDVKLTALPGVDETANPLSVESPLLADSTTTPPAEEQDVEEQIPTPDFGESSPDPSQSPPDAAYLPVYNGEVIRIAAGDTERVTGLLQKGLRFEQFSPQFEQLKTIGRALGCSKPEQVVELVAQALQEAQWKELLPEVGGNEAAARELCAARLRTAVPLHREEKLLSARLAAEYDELLDNCPEAGQLDDLPDEVLRSAAETGRPLLDCWLRYAHREARRCQEAAACAESAAHQTSGALSADPDEGVSAASRSFLAGFRSRL